MKTLDITHMVIDLSPAIPLLDALETAENFPSLFEFHTRYDSVDEDSSIWLEQEMDKIDKHCPWLWPAIDKAILELVSQ